MMEFNQTIPLRIYIHYEELQERNKRVKKREKLTLTMTKKKVLTMSTKNYNQSILYPESEFMNKPSQTNLFKKRFIHKSDIAVSLLIVLASEITPTDHWLNVWCIWYTKLETLWEFWSHHLIGWIIQDFQERFPLFVMFFNVPTGNKDAVKPNSLTKDESHCVYNCANEHP